MWDAKNRPTKNTFYTQAVVETGDGRLLSIWHNEADERRHATIERDLEWVRVIGGRYLVGGDWLPNDHAGGVQIFPDIEVPLEHFVPDAKFAAMKNTEDAEPSEDSPSYLHKYHMQGQITACSKCAHFRRLEHERGMAA